ncbi:MAG: hypothetical protein AB8B57_06545 [Congregibacter sp.]
MRSSAALAGFALLTVVLLALASRQSTWQPWSVRPNVIRWQTQSEVDVFAYDVYRGPSERGPFTPINPQPVLAAGTSDLPQNYRYVDASIAADTVYWYFIESISFTGQRESLTPVYPSRAKTATLW